VIFFDFEPQSARAHTSNGNLLSAPLEIDSPAIVQILDFRIGAKTSLLVRVFSRLIEITSVSPLSVGLTQTTMIGLSFPELHSL
jgi:hypothetical protein